MNEPRDEAVPKLDGPWTPQLRSYGYELAALVLIDVERCQYCGVITVIAPNRDSQHPHASQYPFPTRADYDFNAQLRRAGWKRAAPYDPIMQDAVCSDCVAQGKTTFQCYLCERVQPGNEVQRSFGYPPCEQLCKTCFGTVTALTWADVVDRLTEKHRYRYDGC